MAVPPASLAIGKGGSAAFAVVLKNIPSADATATISGHAGTDATPSPASQKFNPSDWGTA